MKFKKRTHTCGELRESNIGKSVVLNGWVAIRRDLGGVIFIELRDRFGLTQVVFEPSYNLDSHEHGKKLRSEFVISIEGKVRKRPEGTENPALPTGNIDVMVDHLVILNHADTPPFAIEDNIDAHEDLRLKFRYLDLRRPEMQKSLLLRHKMYLLTRKYFDQNGFVEIETPILMKSTPEGARDFLVPSRLHKGKFYALPQSPQTYKQILMVAGMDRYFQIVKCFRDEDLRADRQYEFTQIDVEMSFVDVEDIFEIVEGLMKIFYKEVLGIELETPIKRLVFDEAMEKYGSDKPDLRFGLEMVTLNKVFEKSDFRVFREALDGNGIVTGLVAKGCGDYTRNQLDVLTDFVKKLGAGGLIWMRVKENDVEAPIAKFLTEEEKKSLVSLLNAESGDLLLLLSGNKLKTLNIMGHLRLEMAKRMNLIQPDSKPALLWVTDFPLFEWDEDTKRFYAMHHPFTSPRVEDIPLMDTDPAQVKARAYDLVLNGNEIAGGSIRIHDSALQAKMFNALGISDEEAQEKFGFLTGAFKYGAPPHGGIAFGFDRLAMLFAGRHSIRDVIAFPKTSSGISLMDESPSSVDENQLKELHIRVRQ
ncbi:MAG: aspartate--tRNA ligase [Stygiobacter sp. RIFOXYC12_FULL_38_8]|nr:MAG: aspartate--tRNA ligase [Stygiobacter sp. GWC2_38_9]OGU84248.1 MAG: aspartate--tRNA ligase [Stygiobacter sp. RIFOXYA12_FULL_38_9]OGV05918.1 MAG: aspartate--tRNA ligase [Stygiobacter sp. RIFOXYB2_FULL_37_11]OGV10670.1 MAG: aspartate--tRNA ligase [Stygiobacter sp. RIFOXYA2_FULL_38_8]OGV14509.1 MAG: aspartate--tRNA ligase [Stygiobacter sp. RIFOXYC2_FULL_38_25]OGV28897.1 MAG: aspartate--tRNA ligase [Stygiobacter sp. RIFOXYC12_FULL_38_8]OGV82269.1 MAG: aspartate--tRNA ligase [Stygiobacter s